MVSFTEDGAKDWELADVRTEEIELNEMQKNNQDTKQKSTQFWKQVSNGLRTPLNVIKGTADLAQNEIYNIETVKDGFQKIEESSEFLINVVNDIVDYVTIENGELEILQQPFNLNAMITQLVTKYYNKATSQQKHLDAQIHGVLHENLIGDEHRVEQILECMLNNGLKYTAEKDRLYFEIFETGISENMVSMRFTMTGTNRKLYDYLTGTVNGKVVTEATDLALYNSHYILLNMGGLIKVVLDEKGNSRIIIDITFGIDNKEHKENTLFEKEHVLIICDSKEEAEARGELLTEMKVSFEIATDSEDALEMIGEAEEAGDAFSTCVVDWNVQNFSLQDFVNDVFDIFGKSMPLIAMAYNVDKVKEQALKMGFHYVMDHTWFRSTICDVLMKNINGAWKELDAEANRKKYDFRNKHILVAEDTSLNMEFIVQILTNAHADVICAANGMEAYNLFKQKPEGYFDCILMDINMPEMDGYEATKNIRKVKRSDAETVPIFALTANAFQSDIRDALAAGMNGHFSKPIDIDRMYRTLEDLFQEVQEGTFDGQAEQESQIEALDEQLECGQEEQDALTGLLSLYGMEEQVTAHRYSNHPVGFLMIEVKDYEQIAAQRGEKTAEQILCLIAEKMKEEFRSSDLLARYGTSCFAVLVDHCRSGLTFTEKKIRKLNDMLAQAEERLRTEVYCGAAYTEHGYSQNLVSLSFDALNQAKQLKQNLYSLEDDGTLRGAESLGEVTFGTQMFYLQGKTIKDIKQAEESMALLLEKNQAVGILCGMFAEGMPVCSASGFALNNLGYDAGSFMRRCGGRIRNVIDPDDYRLFAEAAHSQQPVVKRLRMEHSNGSILWFNTAFLRVESAAGEPMWLASLRPLNEDIVGELCEQDYVTVNLILPEENTIIMEKGCETIYPEELKLRKKYNYESLLKTVFVRMHKEKDRAEYLYNMNLKNVLQQLEQNHIYEFVAYQTRENGESIPIRYKYRYLDGTKKMILLTQEYVENLVESDDVTSLLNEKGFYRSVRKILSQPENAGKNYAILYTNMKDFKTCNEMLGFANGNVLLRRFAEYMKKSELQPVCGARFHADQFCFLIETVHLNYDCISEICYKKVNINGNTLNVRLHCGIYIIDEREQEVATMCGKAVLATESITNEYAMPYYIFDENVNKNYKNRVFVLNNLDRAFVRDEFQVYFQPVCDVKTGKISSAEALIRWIMPGGKIVPPGQFVPVLENRGYISKLDLLVAEKVRQFTEERIFAGKRAVPVSINLSRMDFLNDTFLQDLQQKIAQIQVDKSLFCYEVTESAYVNVGDDGRNLVDLIRKEQGKIYIDDFGTGYSSLQNLMEIQFDVLKLDMYFIRRIGNNPIAEGIIDAAIHVCQALGRKIIAEGVETEEQYRFLAERGCDYIQGYYFYKPMSGQEFARLLDSEA